MLFLQIFVVEVSPTIIYLHIYLLFEIETTKIPNMHSNIKLLTTKKLFISSCCSTLSLFRRVFPNRKFIPTEFQWIYVCIILRMASMTSNLRMYITLCPALLLGYVIPIIQFPCQKVIYINIMVEARTIYFSFTFVRDHFSRYMLAIGGVVPQNLSNLAW